MLLTPHTIVGITIASQTQSPILAAGLAFASHFALDLIPHWDFLTNAKEVTKKIKLKIVGDFLVALAIGLIFTLRAAPQGNSLNILLGAFFANLPDGLEMPFSIYKKTWAIPTAISRAQHALHSRIRHPFLGLLPQVVLAAACLAFLLD